MSDFSHDDANHNHNHNHNPPRPSIYTVVAPVAASDPPDYGHADDPGFFDAPPHPSFLDNILNPAGLDHNRFSPFAYRPDSPPGRISYAYAYAYTYPHTPEMPPSTRAHLPRPARLPNGYVDLTSAPESPPQRPKRQSPAAGPSAKRQKRAHGSASSRDASEEPKIDEVDLTEDKDAVHQVLQKQREDAVKSQTKPDEKPTTFNTFNCVICMDMPTDLTATACGHLFCHTCLMEALVAGENRAGPGEPKRSQCPVCRKFINRNKSTDVIPLLLRKGMATQPRKKTAPPPTAVATTVQ
ncbi:hypothetical protein DE146DRAFT_287716 [Phaeosphaeria sp. MPI-PUGE-AT-0046c]|nr:hypothetical protein DE146DRAFT_287716 [Phaeosphaeria sp. MPI-PUGE-AT-0046c]